MPEPADPREIEDLMKMLGVGAPKAPSPAPSASAKKEAAGGAPGKMELEPLAPSPAPRAEASLDLLHDVNVQVRVELGRSKMYVEDILKLGPGSVVSLESLTGDPLDIYVNDRLVARGEVLVIGENLAVRVTEVVAPQEPQEK